MRGTYSPDVVIQGFGSIQGYKNFEEWALKNGFHLREHRIYSIQMPMENKKIFNDKLNQLKQFVAQPRFKVPNNIFVNPILKIIEHQTALKPFQIKDNWNLAVRHECLNACLHFVAFQDYTYKCNTDEERENFKNLEILKTENYKRDGEELIIDEPMPEQLRDELIKRGEFE